MLALLQPMQDGVSLAEIPAAAVLRQWPAFQGRLNRLLRRRAQTGFFIEAPSRLWAIPLRLQQHCGRTLARCAAFTATVIGAG